MYFNHANSHVIDFSYNIIIDNVPLERKRTTTFLGVIIDENLNWNKHIRHITTSISRNVGLLYKMKKLIPCYTLVMLYN